MNDEQATSFLAWVPVGLAAMSGAFWCCKRVISYGQRLIVLENAISDDRADRIAFMLEYKADQLRGNQDSKSIVAVETKVDMILEELRKR